ncbi:MAG TPA: type II CAAX endopeptidase family protein [Candidatus Acidoferrum sp.]|nr:type II CAAX endopeptidase family protein [Candidatus Acidoferrum sp.]
MEIDPSTCTPATPPAMPPPQNEFLRTIFLKEDGLRAGWRLVIYSIFIAAMGFGTELLIYQFAAPARDGFSIRYQILQELANFIVLFGAALIMARIELRPAGVYGLPAQDAFKKLFWQGCLFGLCEISAVIGLIALCGGYSFGSWALHGTEIVRWGALWCVFFLVVALYEEFLFRGYTQFTLADGIGFWPAAVILSISFGLVHRQNPGETKVGIAGVMLVGLFWCFTLRRTGSLWFAVGMHASFDFGETFLYSVPDSGLMLPGHLSNAALYGPAWLTGGTPGPEGSVFDFAILILFFYIFHRLYPLRLERQAHL